MNGSILISSDLEQRKYCSEVDRYSQCYLSGLSVCIRFNLYIINCTVYHQNFIFPKFPLGGQNFAKNSLKFRVNQRKFTGIHVKCQSTFVRTKDEIQQTLLSLLLHSTVMDTIVTQSWCFKMAHGMLSSVDAIVTFEVARIWNWHVDRRLFLISHAWNMHRPPMNTQDSQQLN